VGTLTRNVLQISFRPAPVLRVLPAIILHFAFCELTKIKIISATITSNSTFNLDPWEQPAWSLVTSVVCGYQRPNGTSPVVCAQLASCCGNLLLFADAPSDNRACNVQPHR
jgi:hypothetical protein